MITNVTVTDKGEVLLVFSLPINQLCSVTVNLSTDDISGQTADKYEYFSIAIGKPSVFSILCQVSCS